jgi:soluble lytic murein transglycosylase-like protein
VHGYVAWRLAFVVGLGSASGAEAMDCNFLDPASVAKFAAIAALCTDIIAPPAVAVDETPVVDNLSVAVPFAGQQLPALRPRTRNRRAAPIASGLDPLVSAIAYSHRIDPLLLGAIVARESAARPDAVSAKGALGLLQIMPTTARDLGVIDVALLADPRINLATGATYLKQMQARFGGDLALTLAAYNAGPSAVTKYRGIPPYAETRAYVAAIMAHYRAARMAQVAR